MEASTQPAPTPTVGRIVRFYGGTEPGVDSRELAAIINTTIAEDPTLEHSEAVNLTVFDPKGTYELFGVLSCPADEPKAGCWYWTPMLPAPSPDAPPADPEPPAPDPETPPVPSSPAAEDGVVLTLASGDVTAVNEGKGVTIGAYVVASVDHAIGVVLDEADVNDIKGGGCAEKQASDGRTVNVTFS